MTRFPCLRLRRATRTEVPLPLRVQVSVPPIRVDPPARCAGWRSGVPVLRSARVSGVRRIAIPRLRGPVPESVRDAPPLNRRRQRPSPVGWRTGGLQRRGDRLRDRGVARHEDAVGSDAHRWPDRRRAGRSPDRRGAARRLAARPRHQQELAAEPDALRVSNLRRRPQPDDDGVGAGRGAGPPHRRPRCRVCPGCSKRHA